MIFPKVDIRKGRNVITLRGAHHFDRERRESESITFYHRWNAFAFMRISKVQHIRYCDLEYRDFNDYYNAAVMPILNDIFNNAYNDAVKSGLSHAMESIEGNLSLLTYEERVAYLMPNVNDIIQDEDFDTREVVTVIEFNPLFVATEKGQRVRYGKDEYVVKSFNLNTKDRGEINTYSSDNLHDTLNSVFALKNNLDLKDVVIYMEEKGCMGLIKCYELID